MGVELSFELVISTIVKVILWLWVFISTLVFVGIGSYWVVGNIALSVATSCVTAIFISELVRRRYGLIQFFGRLVAHKDIDGSHKPYKE